MGVLNDIYKQKGCLDREEYEKVRKETNDKTLLKYETILSRFCDDRRDYLNFAAQYYNHKIKEVVRLAERVDVYDLEVPETNNFALAAGVFVHNSAKQGRDRRHQAILPLKGKILNVEKARFDKMISSEEIRILITALGVGIDENSGGQDLAKLRYHNIILMCDADVDGSHIRTLLLTFFYRKMRPIIEMGYLYIAQPPLYKVKRGKSERYLKDEAALEDYLIELGVEGIRLKVKGKEITGKDLAKLTKKLIRYRRILDIVARKGDPRIVDAVVESTQMTRELLKSGKKIDLELDKVARYVKKHYPDLKDFEIEIEKDPEHEAQRVIYKSVFNNAPRKTAIDIDFLNSAEYGELKKLVQELGELGDGPYTVLHDDKTQAFEELEPVKEYILNQGKEGQTIQRYKGLGEMNPHQLWETTMDPAVRRLIQVKIEDAVEADQMFTILMGDEVEPRRQFIEENALAVKNLDI